METLIYLIRHAPAGERGSGPEDFERPLSPRGIRQSAWLAGHLRDATITRVISSPYRRCLETALPLAAGHGVGVESAAELGEGHGAGPCLQLMLELGPAGVALCSHGDVIAEVVDHFASIGLIPAAAARFRKGSLWTVEVREGEFLAATYLEPER